LGAVSWLWFMVDGGEGSGHLGVFILSQLDPSGRRRIRFNYSSNRLRRREDKITMHQLQYIRIYVHIIARSCRTLVFVV